MTISINIIRIGLIKYTEDEDKLEDKPLTHIEDIIKGIHTMEEIYTEDTREVKGVKTSNRRNAIFIINQTIGQQSI